MPESTLSQMTKENPSNLMVVQCPNCHELSMISKKGLAGGDNVSCSHCQTPSPIEKFKGYSSAGSI